MSAQTIEDGQSVPAVIIQTGSMLTKHSLRAVAQALGIPAATLAGLRDGSLVAVPREPTVGIDFASSPSRVIVTRTVWKGGRLQQTEIPMEEFFTAEQEPGHE